MNIKSILQDELGLSNVWRINAVNHILMTWQGIILTFVIIVLTVGVPNIATNISLGVGVAVTWLCLRLNRQGRTQLAVGISSTLYGLAIAVSIYTGGALDTMAWTLFMPLILMVSLFINARVGIIASLTIGLYLTFLAWGMESGFVPPLGYTLNTVQKYTISITPFCLMAIEVYFITQAIEKAFQSAREQKQIADAHSSNLLLLNTHLAQSEARFRTIVDSAADGIMMTDENGRIVSANLQLCDWLGYTLDELLTMSTREFDLNSPLNGDPEERQKMHNVLINSPPLTRKTALLRKDGSTFSVEARIVMTEFNNQNVFLGMVRDVTEQELAQVELESSLHEKELLLREIHHWVKNNLQIVTSMLRMQARQSTDPAALDANKALQSRVRSMAIIHQQLYQNTNLSNINFANYIRTLVSDIKSIHNNTLITFEFELEDVNLTVDNALTAGLIVNELVTNALKHAFAEGQEGVVRCKLRMEFPLVIMVVCDSGRGGMTPEQVTSSRTMGMQLLRLLTNQIKGNLELNNDPGTQFVLSFEDQRAKDA